MPRTHTSAPALRDIYQNRQRLEHWYRDNQVYFITARCRNAHRAFATDRAKAIFRDRFDRYTVRHGFVPWVTTLLDHHDHTLGYLREGAALKELMRQLHGSVAKRVNDTLPWRLVPFWSDTRDADYFDGGLRDEKQGRRTYRDILRQAVRAEIVRDWRAYAHARVNVQMERAIRRATQLRAFLYGVRYRRYERSGHRHLSARVPVSILSLSSKPSAPRTSFLRFQTSSMSDSMVCFHSSRCSR